jgi:hypothetical protein
VFQRCVERSAIPDTTMPLSNGKTDRLTFHDLRHTFASHWVMKGGDLFKLQKILGHKTVQMTMRYAHLQPGVFAEDRGRFADLASPVGGTVVELPKRSGTPFEPAGRSVQRAEEPGPRVVRRRTGRGR